VFSADFLLDAFVDSDALSGFTDAFIGSDINVANGSDVFFIFDASLAEDGIGVGSAVRSGLAVDVFFDPFPFVGSDDSSMILMKQASWLETVLMLDFVDFVKEAVDATVGSCIAASLVFVVEDGVAGSITITMMLVRQT
jgi:hypothetical protein